MPLKTAYNKFTVHKIIGRLISIVRHFVLQPGSDPVTEFQGHMASTECEPVIGSGVVPAVGSRGTGGEELNFFSC